MCNRKVLRRVTIVAAASICLCGGSFSISAAVPGFQPETETELLTETETETEPLPILPDHYIPVLPESETETESETESESETEPPSPGDRLLAAARTVSEGLSGQGELSLPPESLFSSYLPSRLAFAELFQTLEDMTETYEGDWSIYLKDLKSGISATLNDRPQDSASLIKLYIAGAVFEKLSSGELSRSEYLDQMLRDMVSVSDNEAANELVRFLSEKHEHRDGLRAVNDFIRRHGFADTHQYNGLEDPELWYGEKANVTSARDCGRLLEEIYRGSFVSHLASHQMEEYLLNQEITWKIPAGIPSSVPTANKTGEKDNTQNDASLVFAPHGDYILCILSTGLTDEDAAVEHIRSLAGTVYEFFEGPLETESETESGIDETGEN